MRYCLLVTALLGLGTITSACVPYHYPAKYGYYSGAADYDSYRPLRAPARVRTGYPYRSYRYGRCD
jgi:hypothetical protein